MKRKIKAILFLSLFMLSLTSLSLNAMHFEAEGDLKMFLDYMSLEIGENGEWQLVRITHCENPGSNCIIGPTIEGPCN